MWVGLLIIQQIRVYSSLTFLLFLLCFPGEDCSAPPGQGEARRRLDGSSIDGDTSDNATDGNSTVGGKLTLAWLPPNYFHSAQTQFSVNISFPANSQERKQLDYSTQYDAASLLPNGSAVLANSTLLPRLVPDLWMATAHGWWVQARSTCSPPEWMLDRAESLYEVRICDLSSAGADPVTFQLFFQVKKGPLPETCVEYFIHQYVIYESRTFRRGL